MSHEKGIEAAQDKIYDVASVDYGGLSRDPDAALQVIKAYLDASGTVIVPREPTEEMIRRSGIAQTVNARANRRGIYRDFLRYSPNPFQTPEESREKK